MYRITAELKDGGKIVMRGVRLDFDADDKVWRFPFGDGYMTVSRKSVESVYAHREEGAENDI